MKDFDTTYTITIFYLGWLLQLLLRSKFEFMGRGGDLVAYEQCDQIRQFFGLWATFLSLWQQLIGPNLLQS